MMYGTSRACALLLGTLAAVVFIAQNSRAEDAHPIVDIESGYLIGASANGKWLDGPHAVKQLKPDQMFTVYDLTKQTGTAQGAKPESAGDVCPDVSAVQLRPKPSTGAVAIAAPWNALPRPLRVADVTLPVYVRAVREFLEHKLIRNPTVKIAQILRVDLDGDGEEEVLLSATNYLLKDGDILASTTPGSYSFVLLRRVIGEKVQSQLIAGEFYPTAKSFNAPNRYEVAAVLDLDGDGQLEVVVHSSYYEGGGTVVYRCSPAKIEQVLSVECGA